MYPFSDLPNYKFWILAIGAAFSFPAKADDVALIRELAQNIPPSIIEETVGAMKCAQR